MAFSFGLHTLSLVLILVAFVFLLLATIGTPIIKTFSLATTSSASFGVFGYCLSGESCLKATYPYTLSTVDLSTTDWYLLLQMRDTLAKVLIVAPIMLGFTFISFVLTIAAHFAALVLLFAAITALISFAGTAVVAIISILLFTPHVAWTGWLLIAAAACLLVAMPVLLLASCSQGTSTSSHNGDVDFNNLLFNPEQKTAMYTFGTDLDKVPPGFLSYKELDSSSSFERSKSTPMSSDGYRQVPDRDLLHAMSNLLTRPYTAATTGLPYHPQTRDIIRGRVSDESTYSEAKMSDVTRSNYYAYNGVSGDQNQDAPPRPQLVDSPTTPLQIRQQMAPVIAPRTATPSRQPQPAPYPVSVAPFSLEVFEHHAQVEGHQPFAQEYVEDGKGFRNNERGADSDNELDFTSVSQRAPNPQYQDPGRRPQVPHNGPGPSHGYQSQPNYSFAQAGPKPSPTSYNGGYAPFVQNYAAPQQRQPTLSETVLSNNPDFGVAGPPKRKAQPGFIPVSRRNNPGLLASTMMGRR